MPAGYLQFHMRSSRGGLADEEIVGVTASSLAYSLINPINKINVQTRGGHFKVSFSKDNNNFKNIVLEGPTCFVFEGKINI